MPAEHSARLVTRLGDFIGLGLLPTPNVVASAGPLHLEVYSTCSLILTFHIAVV